MAIVSTSLMSLTSVHILHLCVHILVTSVMYALLSFMRTLISDISDVLTIVVYLYTYLQGYLKRWRLKMVFPSWIYSS
jgi:hypothetical protein